MTKNKLELSFILIALIIGAPVGFFISIPFLVDISDSSTYETITIKVEDIKCINVPKKSSNKFNIKTEHRIYFGKRVEGQCQSIAGATGAITIQHKYGKIVSLYADSAEVLSLVNGVRNHNTGTILADITMVSFFMWMSVRILMRRKISRQKEY